MKTTLRSERDISRRTAIGRLTAGTASALFSKTAKAAAQETKPGEKIDESGGEKQEGELERALTRLPQIWVKRVSGDLADADDAVKKDILDALNAKVELPSSRARDAYGHALGKLIYDSLKLSDDTPVGGKRLVDEAATVARTWEVARNNETVSGTPVRKWVEHFASLDAEHERAYSLVKNYVGKITKVDEAFDFAEEMLATMAIRKEKARKDPQDEWFWHNGDANLSDLLNSVAAQHRKAELGPLAWARNKAKLLGALGFCPSTLVGGAFIGEEQSVVTPAAYTAFAGIKDLTKEQYRLHPKIPFGGPYPNVNPATVTDITPSAFQRGVKKRSLFLTRYVEPPGEGIKEHSAPVVELPAINVTDKIPLLKPLVGYLNVNIPGSIRIPGRRLYIYMQTMDVVRNKPVERHAVTGMVFHGNKITIPLLEAKGPHYSIRIRDKHDLRTLHESELFNVTAGGAPKEESIPFSRLTRRF